MEPSATPPPLWRRLWIAAPVAVVLFVVGVLIDMLGIINVPGLAVLPETSEGSATVTRLGVGVVLLLVAAWTSVFWRERHPIVVLIAGAVLAAIGVSYLLLLVGAVAYASRRPRPWAVSGAVAAAVLLFAVREATTSWGAALPWLLAREVGTPREPAWIVASFVCAVASMAIAAGVVFGARARHRARLSDVRAEQEHRRVDELTEQMVRQAERERIARDMHDALAHRLSVVSLHAGALEAAAASSGADAGEIARTVREQTHAALQDMRGLIGDLRSGPADASPPTIRGVRTLLAGLRTGGTPITSYVMLEAPERASTQLDSAVHRIVQEALTNAIKHAPRAPIDVHVEVDPRSGARIRVVNPLLPDASPAVPGGGHGTLGIRERAAALDGTAWIGVHDGTFIVDVTLPWQEREQGVDMLGA
ncbi:sensor histidine kinase [Microbacterium sp. No. 7]|uniref:sensor histidine kinase n=1 Tax=Microbacterium sp. No. 7 TaxID=1714373 RepID=UPI0006D1B6CD|nr:histidine kinase [Microbacterium sp. No. 7]